MPDFSEQNYLGLNLIACDEVGRGPLAGPVAACGVLALSFSQEHLKKLRELKIGDSKKLTQAKRQKILTSLNLSIADLKKDQIYQLDGFSFCLKEISPQEIDRINILQASLKAMRECSLSLVKELKTAHILIDGNKTFKPISKSELNTKENAFSLESVIKGDSKSLMIGLASIIAKEYRDHLMIRLDRDYPGYDFCQSKGYPTQKHREQIRLQGVSDVHRKTFKGVKEYL